MAMYEYMCGYCDEPFALQRPMDSRDEPAECPVCFVMSSTRTPPTIITRTSMSSLPRSPAKRLSRKHVMKPDGDGTTGILKILDWYEKL